MKSILLLLLTATFLIAEEPTRADGLSVHMLPDRVAEIGGGHGGFTVTDPTTHQRGSTCTQPEELLAYFQHLAAPIQQNGIWIVTTHPDSYSDSENARLKSLISLCVEKKIPVYTCRGSELPKGWQRAK